MLRFTRESDIKNESRTYWLMIVNGRYRRFGPRLTVSLTEDDHEALTALADKDEVSISWVVRRAIEEYLRRRPTGVREGIQETMVTGGN